MSLLDQRPNDALNTARRVAAVLHKLNVRPRRAQRPDPRHDGGAAVLLREAS